MSFFDDLFDSVNGSGTYEKKRRGKELRTAVTDNSCHHEFWESAIKKLETIKFIDKNNKITSVPSIKNWISTLKSYQKLWQTLKQNGIKTMRPRYINSDAIENYFGCVRAYNYRSNNPSCHNFVATFKSLFITGFIKFHHTSFNCEDEASKQILNMKSLFNQKKDNRASDISSDQDIRMDDGTNESSTLLGTYPVIQEARRERIKIQSRAYTAGWVVRKVIKSLKINCKVCKQSLTTKNENKIHEWINTKEYKKNKKLTYPAESIVRYFGQIFDHTNNFLNEKGHKKFLMRSISTEIRELYDFILDCQTHKEKIQHAFLTLTIKLCIFNWCTTINKILKGKDISRLEGETSLPEIQKNAFEKYKKKLKIKNK